MTTNEFKIIDEKLEMNAGQLKVRPLNKIYLIILHHTAGKGMTVQEINKMHKTKNKWAGIGYHFYVRQDGSVFKGRDVKYIGAHCAGNNGSSIGIALEGDFRKEKPTTEQLESTKQLVQKLMSENRAIKKVLNHNDLYKTLCPVVNLKEMVK